MESLRGKGSMVEESAWFITVLSNKVDSTQVLSWMRWGEMMCNGLKSGGDVRTTRHQPSFHLSLNCTCIGHRKNLIRTNFCSIQRELKAVCGLWQQTCKHLRLLHPHQDRSSITWHGRKSTTNNIPYHYAKRFFNLGHLGYALCVSLSTTNLDTTNLGPKFT